MKDRLFDDAYPRYALTLPACVPLFSQIIQQTQVSDDAFAVN